MSDPLSEPSTDTVQQAAIHWDDKGQPLSDAFNDVYFSRASGIEETRYVFLQHNGLPERWQDWQQPMFTIGETGFGTGLNFLTVADSWLQQVDDVSARLHFVSAEKFPLSKSDLEKALALWPELSSLASELIEQYPPPVAGIHRLYLANQRIVLTLLYGDAGEMFASLKGTDRPLFRRAGNPRINAWFLDGFAPAKNPEMWSDELFQAIADLSGPGTTFSTFTAAGIVRRGLQAVGFGVEKVQGFGHKRDMLCGQMEEPICEPTTEKDWLPATYNAKHQPPWYLAPQINRPQSALVLGGGIAGCATARALAERGIPVTLIEQHKELAQEGSGNPQGIIYPKLSNKHSPLAQFGLMALLHASRYHQQFLNNGGSRCGVLVLPETDQDRQTFQEIATQFPPQLVQLVKGTALSDVAGIDLSAEVGLFFPQLGWINPPDACESLAQHPLIERRTAHIERLIYEDGCWRALDNADNPEAEAPVTIIATAYHSNLFEQTCHLPLKQIRGQISCLPATTDSNNLKTVICGEGYLAPANNGIHTLGATYNIGETSRELRAEDHQTNLQQLAKTDATAAALFASVHPEQLAGRAAFRCTTPDYLPIAGPAPKFEEYLESYSLLRKNARSHIPVAGPAWPGLYLNCGHGSRGMSYAPLCAELIASEICGEVPPLSLPLRQAVHPGRFIIRDLKRGKC